jgi:hypothetical protein
MTSLLIDRIDQVDILGLRGDVVSVLEHQPGPQNVRTARVQPAPGRAMGRCKRKPPLKKLIVVKRSNLRVVSAREIEGRSSEVELRD